METKPAYQTTEFYLTLFSNLATLVTTIAGVLPPKYAVPTLAAVNIGYSIARGIAKNGIPHGEPPALVVTDIQTHP